MTDGPADRIEIDLCLHVTGKRAIDVIQAAVAAEEVGFDSISLPDELCDVWGVGDSFSHEPWTLLSAIASHTSRIKIGTLVMNVANRDAGTTAVAAATLQDLSAGRLWIGLGAGTDKTSPFARDQLAFGRIPAPAPQRRRALERHCAEIRRIWTNTEDGFLIPDPLPPLIIGGFGPKTVELAGSVADGLACPIDGFGDHARPIEDLVRIARESRAASGVSKNLHITAHTGPYDLWHEPKYARGSALYERLTRSGVNRLSLFCDSSPEQVRAAARALLKPAGL